MIDFDVAREICRKTLKTYSIATETIPVRSGFGRVLAEDVASRIDQPPFNRVAMDGYAVPDETPRSSYRIIGVVRAGEPFEKRLNTGECVKIMTGAPAPEGAVKVIPVEQTRVEGDTVFIEHWDATTHICAKGEDVASGEKIAFRGELLTSPRTALLIASGVEWVTVYRRIKAAVFSTGDELVDRLADWGPGKIFDANGPLLVRLLTESGAEVFLQKRLPDDPETAVKYLEDALTHCDIVCLSGGVSAGDFDYIPDAVRRCGLEIHFNRVKIKPGKPMTFASGRNKVVLGFPGNPVSTYVTFHLFGRYVMGLLQNRYLTPFWIKLIMGAPFARSKTVRMEFIPAVLDESGRVRPLEYHGSGHLASLKDAHGFLVVPSGVARIDAGETVSFWPVSIPLFRSVPDD